MSLSGFIAVGAWIDMHAGDKEHGEARDRRSTTGMVCRLPVGAWTKSSIALLAIVPARAHGWPRDGGRCSQHGNRSLGRTIAQGWLPQTGEGFGVRFSCSCAGIGS